MIKILKNFINIKIIVFGFLVSVLCFQSDAFGSNPTLDVLSQDMMLSDPNDSLDYLATQVGIISSYVPKIQGRKVRGIYVMPDIVFQYKDRFAISLLHGWKWKAVKSRVVDFYLGGSTYLDYTVRTYTLNSEAELKVKLKETPISLPISLGATGHLFVLAIDASNPQTGTTIISEADYYISANIDYTLSIKQRAALIPSFHVIYAGDTYMSVFFSNNVHKGYFSSIAFSPNAVTPGNILGIVLKPNYRAKAGIKSIVLSLKAFYHITSNIHAKAYLVFEQLVGDAQKTPATDSPSNISIFAEVSYRF